MSVHEQQPMPEALALSIAAVEELTPASGSELSRRRLPAKAAWNLVPSGFYFARAFSFAHRALCLPRFYVVPINTWLTLVCGVVLFVIVGPTNRARAADGWDAKAEWQLMQLINQTRAQHGLPLPQQDSRLQAAARAHSNFMALHNTLSHHGKSVLDKRLELSVAFFLRGRRNRCL